MYENVFLIGTCKGSIIILFGKQFYNFLVFATKFLACNNSMATKKGSARYGVEPFILLHCSLSLL